MRKVPHYLKTYFSQTQNVFSFINRYYSNSKVVCFSCPQNVKEAAYKGMVHPILEYGSPVWDPHADKRQEE